MGEAGAFAEVVALVGVAAICSGLNVAFMSLDEADLRRSAKLGNSAAIRVLPFRKKGHLTLAAILLTNIAAVSATSIVLDGEFYGFIAGFISTLLIVIFGEIIPQALFSRPGILCAVCAVAQCHDCRHVSYIKANTNPS
jgi:metal transporter CNNM